MDSLEKEIMDVLGDKEVLVTGIHISGWDEIQIYQALVALELSGKIRVTGFETIVREDGGLISIGKYKKN